MTAHNVMPQLPLLEVEGFSHEAIAGHERLLLLDKDASVGTKYKDPWLTKCCSNSVDDRLSDLLLQNDSPCSRIKGLDDCL